MLDRGTGIGRGMVSREGVRKNEDLGQELDCEEMYKFARNAQLVQMATCL